MGFRFAPKSLTSNYLEQRDGHVVCVILPNSVDFGAYYVKVVKDTSTYSASRIKFLAVYHL